MGSVTVRRSPARHKWAGGEGIPGVGGRRKLMRPRGPPRFEIR